MKKDTVVPFAPRPAVPAGDSGHSAGDFKVPEWVEICRGMETTAGLKEVVAKLLERTISIRTTSGSVA